MNREPTATNPRRTPPRRGFRTTDGMILIAAIAASPALSGRIADETRGFVSSRRIPSIISRVRDVVIENPKDAWDTASALSQFVILLVLLSVPVLMMISLALSVIRLTPPRPRRRRLASQPGAVAAWAALVAILFVGTFYAAVRSISNKGEETAGADVAFALLCLPIFVGLSIASAWTTQVAAGFWRPEPSWIDRAGRFVAAAWIACGLFNAFHYLVFRFSVHVGLASFLF
jgi:hypothetical protein